MKSLVPSAILHAAVLTWGLWSLGAPEPLDMSAEALPVSLVPIEEFSQATAGAAEAPVAEESAPTPTETPETLPMPAENVGDNEVDLESPPQPEAAPRERLQTASAETPPPPPPPAPEPEPVAEMPPEPPAPAEPAPAETPPPPVDTAALPAEAPAPAEPAPPQNVPVPSPKPKPPVQVAERQAEPTPEAPRESRTPPPEPEETEIAETETSEEPEFDADEIAALLNREESAGGGARRSEQQAALGASRATGATLSQSELDALRGQIARCWNPPSGVMEAGALRVSIAMKLDQAGQLQGMPEIVSGGGASMVERAAGEAALRAVRRCAPYNLPIEKYDTWADVKINFDPSEMF